MSAERKPWAIYSDYSGVANIGQGGFATELEAIESLIDRLESERAQTADKIASAKRRRRALLSKDSSDGY